VVCFNPERTETLFNNLSVVGLQSLEGPTQVIPLLIN